MPLSRLAMTSMWDSEFTRISHQVANDVDKTLPGNDKLGRSIIQRVTEACLSRFRLVFVFESAALCGLSARAF